VAREDGDGVIRSAAIAIDRAALLEPRQHRDVGAEMELAWRGGWLCLDTLHRHKNQDHE
jgi:hypothetical protein